MEIIEDRRVCDKSVPRNNVAGRIYTGLVFVAAGAIWLLHNFHMLPRGFTDVVFSWQMLVVLCGGFLLAARHWIMGAVITGAGIAFMAMDFLDVHVRLGKIILPAAVIAVGISLIVQRKG